VGVNVSPSSVNSSGSERFGSINCSEDCRARIGFGIRCQFQWGRGCLAKVKKASVEKPG